MNEPPLDDDAFDRALVGAVFAYAGARGWRRTSVAAAAREAGLDLARARRRFPCRGAVLARFGRIADEAALTGAASEGPLKDR
ncbi:MAG: TetR family transcriptional regulator, partial [Acetobacteraceae bacterium]